MTVDIIVTPARAPTISLRLRALMPGLSAKQLRPAAKSKETRTLAMWVGRMIAPAGVLWCFLTVLPAALGQGDQQHSFQQLLQGIKDNEQKLLNLRVDGKCLFLKWDAQKKDWQYNGESDVTAWYVGEPGGRARVDTHKVVCRSTGSGGEEPDGPFGQASFWTAYNGRARQVLLVEDGAVDHPAKALGGRITDDQSYITGVGASGWEYSLYGCEASKKMRLSQYLNRIAHEDADLAKPWSSRFTIQSKDAGRIALIAEWTAGGIVQKETWCFDPSRGFAILFYEDTNGGQIITDELAEPAPGVYYPTKVTCLSKDNQTKTIYQASKIVANDPNFSEDIFNIKWPAGTVVRDEISGRRFTVGQSPDETEKTISNQVEAVRAALTNPPTQLVVTKPDSRGDATLQNTPRRSSANYWLVTLIPLAGIALLVVALKIRKK